MVKKEIQKRNHPKKGDNITYLHSHIADDSEDKWLKVTVDQNDQVKIEAVSLLGLPVLAVDQYTKLKTKSKEPTDVKKKIQNVLKHPVYYIGLLSALVAFLLFRGIKYLSNIIYKHFKTN